MEKVHFKDKRTKKCNLDLLPVNTINDYIEPRTNFGNDFMIYAIRKSFQKLL